VRRSNAVMYESILQWPDVVGYYEGAYSFIDSSADSDINDLSGNGTDFNQATVADQGAWQGFGSADALAHGNGSPVMELPTGTDFYERSSITGFELKRDRAFEIIWIATCANAVGTKYGIISKWDNVQRRGYALHMDATNNDVELTYSHSGPGDGIRVRAPFNSGTNAAILRITYDGSETAAGFNMWKDKNQLLVSTLQDNLTNTIANTNLCELFADTNGIPAFWLGWFNMLAIRTAPTGPQIEINDDWYTRWVKNFSGRYAIRF